MSSGIVHIVLPHWGGSQAAFLAINQANLLVSETEVDVFGYFDSPAKPIVTPCFALANCSELMGAEGLIIATDLDSADKIVNTAMPAKRIFYVWDCEWLRNHGSKDYLRNLAIMRHPDLELVARSESHAELIEHYANRQPVAIIGGFNLQQFIERFSAEINRPEFVY